MGPSRSHLTIPFFNLSIVSNKIGGLLVVSSLTLVGLLSEEGSGEFDIRTDSCLTYWSTDSHVGFVIFSVLTNFSTADF